MRWILISIVLGGLLLLSVSTVGADTRGGGVATALKSGGGIPNFEDIYTGHHALVIGVDSYRFLRQLTGAVRDAQAVSQHLKRRGFKVVELYDEQATERAIRMKLREVAGRAQRNDRLVVFFAGHGVPDPNPNQRVGYLMPINGDAEAPDEKGVPMDWVQRILDGSPAKHVLFAADACYSGLAVQTRAVARSTQTPDYVSLVSKDKARLTFTAGKAGQEAIDDYKGHGLFTYFLLDALDGHADSDNDGFITSHEISEHLQKNVPPIAMKMRDQHKAQIPQVGRGHAGDSGEMIFLKSNRIKTVSDADEPAWFKAPPPRHAAARSAEHPAYDALRAFHHAAVRLGQIKSATRPVGMLDTYRTAEEADFVEDRATSVSKHVFKQALKGLRRIEQHDSTTGHYVLIAEQPHADPYTVVTSGLLSPYEAHQTEDGKKHDCAAAAGALIKGLFYTAAQRDTVQINGMVSSYGKSGRTDDDSFSEKNETEVSKSVFISIFYAPGVSLEIASLIKEYEASGYTADGDFSESTNELALRVRFETPGQQLKEVKLFNGELYKPRDDICKHLQPALKAAGFRFRRVIEDTRDARMVPRVSYIFSISGSPETRGVDGELYETREGQQRRVVQVLGEGRESERWFAASGETPMLNRYGYATAKRSLKGPWLTDVSYFDASEKPVAPKHKPFARRTITYATEGHKQAEAFFGPDGTPVAVEVDGQLCQAYRWKKADACQCKQPDNAGWTSCGRAEEKQATP